MDQMAATLHELGCLNAQTGDLTEALQYLEESLQMKRSMHGGVDHPGIAVTLHKLGEVTAKMNDKETAKQYLQESLRMQRALATLHEFSDFGTFLILFIPYYCDVFLLSRAG